MIELIIGALLLAAACSMSHRSGQWRERNRRAHYDHERNDPAQWVWFGAASAAFACGMFAILSIAVVCV